jgi:hypothetical protein
VSLSLTLTLSTVWNLFLLCGLPCDGVPIAAPLSAVSIFVVSLQILLHNARVSEFLNSANAEFNHVSHCHFNRFLRCREVGSWPVDPRILTLASAQSRADRIQAPLKFTFGSHTTWLIYLPNAVTVAEIDPNKLYSWLPWINLMLLLNVRLNTVNYFIIHELIMHNNLSLLCQNTLWIIFYR